MNAILIIAHAPLANALRQCALHVFPDCGAHVAAIDVQPNLTPEETLNKKGPVPPPDADKVCVG